MESKWSYLFLREHFKGLCAQLADMNRNCVALFHDVVTKSVGDLPTDSSSSTLLQQSFCSLAVWHDCTALASHCNIEIVSSHLTMFYRCCQ
jgi:hypothetical protein